jgi:acyl-coenzyme A thioesterase PaaI-like protein
VTTPPGARPSPHPNIAGREAELEDLAAAVRRLVDLTCRNTADAPATAAIARDAHALADRLDDSTPSAGTLRRFETFDVDDPSDLFQYDAVVGPYNPTAPPIRCRWEDPFVFATAVFANPWEGPPGVLHGGMVAAAFDAVLTVANIMTLGHPAPTARLEITYRAPTPLDTEVTMEATVRSVDGRKVTTAGSLRAGETLCAEAEGLFIDLGASPHLIGYAE